MDRQCDLIFVSKGPILGRNVKVRRFFSIFRTSRIVEKRNRNEDRILFIHEFCDSFGHVFFPGYRKNSVKRLASLYEEI